jgi:hypothetical protein
VTADGEARFDLGWDLADWPTELGARSSVMLLTVAGAYWASIWLLGGLPPLTVLLSRGFSKWRRPASHEHR